MAITPGAKVSKQEWERIFGSEADRKKRVSKLRKKKSKTEPQKIGDRIYRGWNYGLGRFCEGKADVQRGLAELSAKHGGKYEII